MFTKEEWDFLVSFLNQTGYEWTGANYHHNHTLARLGVRIAQSACTGPFTDHADFAAAIIITLFHDRHCGNPPTFPADTRPLLRVAMRWSAAEAERAMERGLVFVLRPVQHGQSYDPRADPQELMRPWTKAWQYLVTWVMDINKPVLACLFRQLPSQFPGGGPRHSETEFVNDGVSAALIAIRLCDSSIILVDSHERLRLNADRQRQRRVAEQCLTSWGGGTPLADFLRRACSGGNYVNPLPNVLIYGMTIDVLEPPVQRGNVLNCTACHALDPAESEVTYPTGECPRCARLRLPGGANITIVRMWFEEDRTRVVTRRCKYCQRMVFVDPAKQDEPLSRNSCSANSGPHSVVGAAVPVWVRPNARLNPPSKPAAPAPTSGPSDSFSLFHAWDDYQVSNGLNLEDAYVLFWRGLTMGVPLADAIAEHVAGDCDWSAPAVGEFVRLMVLRRQDELGTFDLPAPPAFWSVPLTAAGSLGNDTIARLQQAVDRALREPEVMVFDPQVHSGSSNNG